MSQQGLGRPDAKIAVLDLLSSHQLDARISAGDLDQKLGVHFKRILEVARKAPWWETVISENRRGIDSASTMSELVRVFPVLSRADIQSNPASFWTRPSLDTARGYRSQTTSGSTGKPVTVFRNQRSHSVQHGALELLDAVWQRRDVSKNSAFLKAAPENDERAELGEPFSYLGPTGKVFRRSIANNTIPALLDLLTREKIKNFLVNPFVLKFLIAEQLKSPRDKAQFDQIMTWADRLDPKLRKSAFEVFGSKLCDRYSSSEFGFLAIQCPEAEHLHALQFSNYIEILNEEGERCAVGEPGRVVVTSLENLAMPLIRYELGDIAAFGKPCEHGINLPVFEPKISRMREVVLLDDGSLELPYFDGTAIALHPDTVDYQCYRFSDGVALLFQAKTEIGSETIEATKQKLAEIFRKLSRFQVVQVQSLEWLGFWKRKLMIDIPQELPAEIDQAFVEFLKNR